jgi:hypothetical protein
MRGRRLVILVVSAVVVIVAIPVGALSDDFTVEPIFVREALGKPLLWTGALPTRLEGRVNRALPEGFTLRRIVEGGRFPS